MNTFQFIISLGWALVALIAVSFAGYLVLSGRLKWVEYQTAIGKIGVKVTANLGIKDLTPDEIIAFESFVYRDLENMERGVRLAYVILFVEKELLHAQFENNTLIIELTDKGKELHSNIISECEKKLMISPKTDIKWRAGEKKVLAKAEEKTTKSQE